MVSDSDKECCDAMRQRIIPKLIQTEKNEHVPGKQSSVSKRKIEKDIPNGDKETNKERVERISHTNVSFMEFWMQCIDWNMLRLFFGLLMLFFFAVGFATLLYLMFVFSFKENLWYYYFPVSNKEEL
eukprot:GFUD01075961.1.p1 GENE.GFUD01075961.1~~GFUD01075961.1.p1  ORF type:complete len:127 (+),score=32.39 GFUD01075961.1:76-456(+)